MTCRRSSWECLCAFLQLWKPQGHASCLGLWILDEHIFCDSLVCMFVQSPQFKQIHASFTPLFSLLLPHHQSHTLSIHYWCMKGSLLLNVARVGPNLKLTEQVEAQMLKSKDFGNVLCLLQTQKLTGFRAGSDFKRSSHPAICLCQVSDSISILMMR